MSSVDPFQGYSSKPYAVFDNALQVVPSDDDDLPVVATTLHIETDDPQNPARSADVSITTAGGQRYVLQVDQGLIWLPVRVRKVWATGTTAKSVLALW